MSELTDPRTSCRASAWVRPRRFRSILTAATMTVLSVLAASTPGKSQAAQRTLVIANAFGEHRFTAAELLARPDAKLLDEADAAIPGLAGDIYHQKVAYRAVPVLSLLGSDSSDRFDTVEARASDGFVSQIPLALITQGEHGGAVAFIAVEDPAYPWPPLPGKTESAGPFYLIWEHPEKSGVTREQWPYQLVRLSLVESPVHRWPQLLAPTDLPAGAPAFRGQDLFITQCLPCHRLNGGGASDTGPDLGRPMNPTQYLTDPGLRAIIRNPRAVRTWPNQQMIGFGKRILSDADLDAVVAYLRAMAPSNQ
jgi:mono/diheme cytochrome c family protein